MVVNRVGQTRFKTETENRVFRLILVETETIHGQGRRSPLLTPSCRNAKKLSSKNAIKPSDPANRGQKN